MPRGERGLALLEAIVALAILSTAGLALAAQVRQTLAATSRIEQAELRIVEASRFLEAVSLWTRADLDRHLGDRPNGPWRLVVVRPAENLYDVAVRDSATRRTLVATSIYRGRDVTAP